MRVVRAGISSLIGSSPEMHTIWLRARCLIGSPWGTVVTRVAITGEFGFAFTVLFRATAVVGTCEVSIYTDVDGVDLVDLTDAAAQIGRSVGCSAYRNDFVAAELPELRSRLRGWLTPGFPPYIPPGLDRDR